MPEKRVNPSAARPSAAAERSGTDLFLDLRLDTAEPARGRGAHRRRALAESLREAIATGRLAPGTRLPPYRSLAADLGLARGTVAAAYAELVAEGRLAARQGSGTTVAGMTTHRTTPEHSQGAAAAIELPPITHDFALGQPNPALFPRTAWAAATRRALRDAPDSAFAPSPPNGSHRLREVLAEYLARARGVRTTAANIVLTTSVQASLDLLARTIFHDSVAIESYGLPFHRDTIAARGVPLHPLPVDQYGVDVSALQATAFGNEAAPVCAAVLTPSHQFPLGVALSPARRTQIVDIAARSGMLIVEDDYDGELRYDRTPVGALQGLAPDSVIYTGSVSKSLSPAVRIGWLVLPTRLVPTVMWAKGIREPDASIVDQLTLAELINAGTYDSHIRRSRQFYRARRDRLITRLAAEGIEVSGIAAGLHAVIPMPASTEADILAEAFVRGFAFGGLDAMRHPAAPPNLDESGEPLGGIIVGFGSPAASTYARDLDALAEVLRTHLPKRRLRAAKSRSARKKSTRRNSGQ